MYDAPDASAIQWLPEPPAATNPGHYERTGKYEAFFDACRANPGKWALLVTSPSTNGSLQSGVKDGALRGSAPAGSFEATSRRIDGKSHTYVRYVGAVPQPTNGQHPAEPATRSPRGAELHRRQAIREWARALGLPVSDRGRVPSYLVDAYDRTHKP